MSKPSAATTRHLASEKAAAVGAVGNDEANGVDEPSTKKDFETEYSGVFAAPGLLRAYFNCESGLNGRNLWKRQPQTRVARGVV
jgi:hypothetical protein